MLLAFTSCFGGDTPSNFAGTGRATLVLEYVEWGRLVDVMDKIDNATYNLMRAYFPLIRKGINPRKPQNINDGNFRRLRTDKDSKIDWDKNANVIYNQIRAISKPYPGAYFNYENKKIRIWKSEIIDFNLIDNKFHLSSPGTIINKGVNYFIIKCRDKFIKAITDD